MAPIEIPKHYDLKKHKIINKMEKYQSGISSLNRLHFNRLTFDD